MERRVTSSRGLLDKVKLANTCRGVWHVVVVIKVHPLTIHPRISQKAPAKGAGRKAAEVCCHRELPRWPHRESPLLEAVCQCQKCDSLGCRDRGRHQLGAFLGKENLMLRGPSWVTLSPAPTLFRLAAQLSLYYLQ